MGRLNQNKSLWAKALKTSLEQKDAKAGITRDNPYATNNSVVNNPSESVVRQEQLSQPKKNLYISDTFNGVNYG